MPTKREIEEMHPADREQYEIEREERARRKDMRTKWNTGATEAEKATSLRVALNSIGGGKKYSWLKQEPTTVASTLGPKRAAELGITEGKLAEELQIGNYEKSKQSSKPKTLLVKLSNLCAASFEKNRNEFEKSLRDAGTPEDQIRVALGEAAPTPAPAPAPAGEPTEGKKPAATATDEQATPAPQSKKRHERDDDEDDEARPVKKRQ